ncbi:hypothetical protein FOL47_002756 [Perkinsus chesapeaki]|uniref:SET domain-containing protein n=1 Tax=Perkinsus chesapeaki TaxID=330153 RepID=A0A7J6N019_PERCH|nr:hypothetical protein FOL47_002756 [Perkinsus chesapeaki]
MTKKKSRKALTVEVEEEKAMLPEGFQRLLPAVPGHSKSGLRPLVRRMSGGYEVRYNSECGMGLYATEDIPEGCVLLEEEPAVTIKPHGSDAVAGALDTLLWIMNNFDDARKLRQYLYPRVGDDIEGLPESMRDDIKSFSMFFSHEQSKRWLARPDAWSAVMNVFDDDEETPSEALCREFIKTFEKFSRSHSDKEISEMATINECVALNSFKNTITKGGVACGGAATCVFLLASLLNHSCMPNVSISTHSPDGPPLLRAVTVRPVMAGEQLCMSYFGHHLLFATSSFFDSVAERRERMVKEKHFTCMCHRCQDETSGLSDWESFLCPRCDGGSCLKEGDVFQCRKCGSEESVLVEDVDKWFTKATLTLRLMMSITCEALAAARAAKSPESLAGLSEKLMKLAVQGGVLPESLGGLPFAERKVMPHEEHCVVHRALTLLVHSHRLNAMSLSTMTPLAIHQSKALLAARKTLQVGSLFDETFASEGKAAVFSADSRLIGGSTPLPPSSPSSFSPPTVHNSFVLRFASREQHHHHQCIPPAAVSAPDLRSIVARLLSFGDVQKLDFQHWRELGIITACYFDTRNAEKAFDHYYMLGEQSWEVLWSECQDQDSYFVSVPAEDLASADPSQYGDMANISSPPGESSGELKLLIQFFDCRAARSMREVQRKALPVHIANDPGSASTVSSSLVGGLDFGAIPSLVDRGAVAPTVLVNTVSRMASLSPPPLRASSGPLQPITPLDGTTAAVAESPDDYSVKVDRCWVDPRTTIMIKNIPNKLTQQRMLQMIDDVCPQSYDFFYLPIDLRNRCNVGYAFINFIDPARIVRFYTAFHGTGWKSFNNSKKICDLSYARIQGKEALRVHFTSATLPKNPAMRPLFRVGQSLQPLRIPGETMRYSSCVTGKDMMSLDGLLPEPTRARTLPAGRPLFY